MQGKEEKDKKVVIIGGGLAGCEAAWQIAQRGVKVLLFEMKPEKFSPAHKSSLLAELVCSNSLGSDSLENAGGLLKEELRHLNSLIIQKADLAKIPAGKALAVDREEFSLQVTQALENLKEVEIIRKEIKEIPSREYPVIIASGPLTSEPLSLSIKELTGEGNLYIYDAISPIVEAGSLNFSKIFPASRYQKDQKDYLNCPLNQEEYERFIEELGKAEKVPPRDFEELIPFEGCMPIETMLERGRETLLFGPMRPVGLIDPRTGKQPYAVVQLRAENRQASLYNLVGFQTRLKWGEQERVFRLIHGLEKARFARLGSLHRNTFINTPLLLKPTLQMKKNPRLFFAGQMVGVEGYVESTAMGLLAGINATLWLKGKRLAVPPPSTTLGALISYIIQSNPERFQPMKANFGLLPPLDKKIKKREKREFLVKRALEDLENWKERELNF